MSTLVTNSTNTDTMSAKHSGHDFGTSPNVCKIGAQEAVKLLSQIFGDGLDVLVLRNRKLQQPGSVVVHPVDQLGPVVEGVPLLRVLKPAQAVLDAANYMGTFSLNFFNSFRHCKLNRSASEE